MYIFCTLLLGGLERPGLTIEFNYNIYMKFSTIFSGVSSESESSNQLVSTYGDVGILVFEELLLSTQFFIIVGFFLFGSLGSSMLSEFILLVSLSIDNLCSPLLALATLYLALDITCFVVIPFLATEDAS